MGVLQLRRRDAATTTSCNAKALATSVSEKDGKTHPVAWINQYGKARVFGTTYGHSDDTFGDPVFLEYLSRGVLWAAGRLEK